MKLRTSMLAVIAAGSLVAAPAWADRGHGHGQGHFWGPFGLLLGSAILYSAVQPRTVYYAPQVAYAPPVTAFVRPYYAEPTYVNPPLASMPPPPQHLAWNSALDPAASQWWYFCNSPNGYYPYVRECPSGWEKVSPTPPGVVNP